MAASLYLTCFTRSSRHLPRKVASLSCFFICSPATNVPITSYATTAAVEAGGSGGSHWKMERVVAVAMVGLIPAALIYPNTVVDYGLALALPMHGHWGMEAVLEDYVPQSWKKLAYPLLYCISIGTFAGLMYLNYTDVGICKAVQIMWSLK